MIEFSSGLPQDKIFTSLQEIFQSLCPHIINHCIILDNWRWQYLLVMFVPKKILNTLLFLEYSCPELLTTHESFCHDGKRIKVVSPFHQSIAGQCFDICPQHMLWLDDATQTYRMSCELTTNGSFNGNNRYGSHSCYKSWINRKGNEVSMMTIAFL